MAIQFCNIHAQDLSFSGGAKYGLDINGKLKKNSSFSAYNFTRYNDESRFDAGLYIDSRYRFHKRFNWHVSVFGELSTLHYQLRMIDTKLSGEEHAPIRMDFQRFTFGFGIHKYFTLYDGKLSLDIGVQFQFRNYFQSEKTYGTLEIDAPLNPNPVPVNLYVLSLEHKTETKIESFNFSPDLLFGLKYPINDKTLINIGAQLSFPHFIYTEYAFKFRYFNPESTTLGYTYSPVKRSSTITYLYLNIGLTKTIIRKKNDKFNGL